MTIRAREMTSRAFFIVRREKYGKVSYVMTRKIFKE